MISDLLLCHLAHIIVKSGGPGNSLAATAFGAGRIAFADYPLYRRPSPAPKIARLTFCGVFFADCALVF
jgi:hypothetical protein